MRVVAIIQARLGSTRFPQKVLADLCGKPVLQHVMERAWAIPGVDGVGLTIPHDNLLAFNGLAWLDSTWLGCRPEADVLLGYASLAREMQADVILRLTADCPLIAPEVCERDLGRAQTGE